MSLLQLSALEFEKLLLITLRIVGLTAGFTSLLLFIAASHEIRFDNLTQRFLSQFFREYEFALDDMLLVISVLKQRPPLLYSGRCPAQVEFGKIINNVIHSSTFQFETSILKVLSAKW